MNVDSPTYSTAKYGDVPLVQATAVTDDTTGAITVFAVNGSQSDPLPLEVVLRGFDGLTDVVEHSVPTDPDPDARNTLDQPKRVTPDAAAGTVLDGAVLRATLPALSWNIIRLA